MLYVRKFLFTGVPPGSIRYVPWWVSLHILIVLGSFLLAVSGIFVGAIHESPSSIILGIATSGYALLAMTTEIVLVV